MGELLEGRRRSDEEKGETEVETGVRIYQATRGVSCFRTE